MHCSYASTILAYGQTGSGKTFTMSGYDDKQGAWSIEPAVPVADPAAPHLGAFTAVMLPPHAFRCR